MYKERKEVNMMKMRKVILKGERKTRYLSDIPTGKTLPAQHYVTKLPNRVKVGAVPIGKTPGETITQPVYLRYGYGIFLRKHMKPRREHYGPEEKSRVIFHNSECEDYSRSMRRALFTQGVIMTNKPITAQQLDPQFKELAVKPLSSEECQAIEEAVEMIPDLHKIVRRNSQSRRLMGPILYHTDTEYMDHEDRKTPPPFFIPLPPLPAPIYVTNSAEDIYVEENPLLRRPELPILWIAARTSDTHIVLTEASSNQFEAEMTEKWREYVAKESVSRRCEQTLPRFVPRVLMSSTSVTTALDPRPCLKITSDRLQEGLVDLEDMFPYKADEGLLAEIAFYKNDENFPLLLTRNLDVDPEKFQELNYVRLLPPEKVARVDTLTKIVAYQREMADEVKREDPDLKEKVTYVQDKVFNPLSYPFNKKVYKKLKKLSERNKLDG